MAKNSGMSEASLPAMVWAMAMGLVAKTTRSKVLPWLYSPNSSPMPLPSLASRPMPHWEGWRPTRNRPTGSENSAQARDRWTWSAGWPSSPVVVGLPANSDVDARDSLSPQTTPSRAFTSKMSLARESYEMIGRSRSLCVAYRA